MHSLIVKSQENRIELVTRPVPYQLRFLPSMSSRIAVLSSLGQVQLVDTATLSTPHVNVFQVNMGMEDGHTISMDISPSNQCLAFGDTANALHLYSSVPEPVLNPFARCDYSIAITIKPGFLIRFFWNAYQKH